MTKYLFAYRNPQSNESKQPSPEEMQAMFAQWTEWKTKFQKNMVDMGDGLKPGGRVLNAQGVTDGAFVETKEVLGGFSIIQAENYEQALEVAKACPITFMPGYSVEIREMAGF